MPLIIPQGGTVLFQGDSITDCGRSREDDAQLGGGYANMVAAWYGMLQPEARVTFVNRGISGNRVRDLQARWRADCIDLQPDVVSVLIGVNDTWRRYDSGDPTSTEAYHSAYRDILEQTRREVAAEIVLLEPFVLPCPEDRKEWRIDLDPKIQVVRELAREFDAVLIPLDGLFAAACVRREPPFWAADGVHPSQTGHALIAAAWLDAAAADW
jgi:lysophospholipase L1-like esterase